MLGWLINTVASLIGGLVWGVLAYGIVEGVKAVVPGLKADGEHAANAVAGATASRKGASTRTSAATGP